MLPTNDCGVRQFGCQVSGVRNTQVSVIGFQGSRFSVQRLDNRRQMTEVRGQRTEVRKQRTKGRELRAENISH